MTSTYTSFRFYTANLPRTIARVGASGQNSREAQYYLDNIGKVKSVDDFLKNDRLYQYAMRANGLTDMVGSKAFMRKVLQSDLTDTRSFARSLVDQRFVAFARAFDFTTTGDVRINTQVVQTDEQEADTTGLYSEHRARQGEAAATEAQYYKERIAPLTNVDQFLRDQRLFDYALKAYGLDPSIASVATIRDVLTSDLSDPDSRANQLGGKYIELRNAFAFEADGTVATGASLQTADQLNETIYRNYEKTGNGASPAAAAFKTQLYEAAIPNITSVDDFLANDKLFEYALTAAGLDPILETKASIRQILTSDLSDPDSAANQISDTRYRALTAAFNFDTDGTVKAGEQAQSAAQLDAMTENYLNRYDDKAEAADSLATSYFTAKINTKISVGELFADTKLYTYLLEAFGFDPNVEQKATIKKVLESDISDPKSFVNTLPDKRYKVLAAAVNFAADGKVATPLVAQVEREILAAVQLYNAKAGTDLTDTQKNAVKAESLYYTDTVNTAGSVDDLLGDKRLVAYIKKAYGIENLKISDADLRKVLTSDPNDKTSFVNKQQTDERLKTLAAAFNFKADGSLARAPSQQAQTRKDVLTTANNYLQQAMETEAGSQSEGVRLALYFQRKAPNINTAFDILADKALVQVARTALGLPVAFSQADIDVQARTIEKRLKLADLKDPAKLEKFIAKFSALYDVTNASSSSSTSPASLLLSGQSTGFGQSLLASMQGVRTGRT